MARVWPPLLRLPPELLLKIARCIDSHDTFFSFLDILGSPKVRGALEHIFQLGLVHSRDGLWPQLWTYCAIMENTTTRSSLEAAIPLYESVVVACNDTLTWLLGYLQPHTTIQWVADFPRSETTTFNGASMAVENWYDRWAQLPWIKVQCRTRPSPLFFAVLPRCTKLVCLDLRGHRIPLDVVFKYAASSPTLVELFLRSHGLLNMYKDEPLPATTIGYAVKWLRSARVQTFHFATWTWAADVDTSLRQEFYATMVGCPTLSSLTLSNCPISHAPFPRCPDTHVTFPSLSPRLRSLALSRCPMTTNFLSDLASTLPTSSIEDLRLSHLVVFSYFSPEILVVAFKNLLHAVAQSNITTLSLCNCDLHDAAWHDLSPLLQQSNLQHVRLVRNGITGVGAVWIGRALQRNASVRTLDLSYNAIDVDGAIELVHCMAHRAVPMDEIRLKRNTISSPDKPRLEALALALGIQRLTLA
ncbi:Aste57867_22791 [Aphanomyces stellatus]|uniref:Aste57867_22791 protein n=1 Tax=Aphanomyces stellatus TaxID=120398 RepID=A0A485LKX8_9STRA|nr:hypothetical protein As57867_022721 [Aphanomyces stellatus]VFT99444.1 Aste57867_22791 [Aphanomyces stellatus]